jgi:hypothetical protein
MIPRAAPSWAKRAGAFDDGAAARFPKVLNLRVESMTPGAVILIRDA